jgi:polysaccharide biosynthesis/export protein
MKHILPTVLVLLLVAGSVFSEDSGGASTEEGFGLQASIFRNARAVTSDLNRNFTDASKYNLTPGDLFTLTLSSGIGLNATSGNSVATYMILLQDDYTFDIPVLGRVDARDRRIPELQRHISESLKKALTLQHASFNLSEPAQYNVFVYGNVQFPGFVVVSPMHRLIDAIGTAGGFKANGSYRNIRLERDGSIIPLDISRFYSHADFGANPFLRPGDKIFVPDAEAVASISGLIQFPGSYELIEAESLQTLINLAGGVLPGAKTGTIEIHRIDADGVVGRLVVPETDARDVALKMGDQVLIRSISENVERITIEGAIYGSRLAGDSAVAVPDQSYRIDFPHFPGITLLDILDSVGGPTPRALLEKSFLRRAATGEIRPLEIARLWSTRDELLNTSVFPGDYIFIPLQRIEIFVTGSVGAPGAVPYVPGYSVSDYLMRAGGVDENRANTKAIDLLDATGGKTAVTMEDTVAPGSHIHVGKKWLFAADQTIQNVFITTAWVTSVLSIVTTVIQFVLTYFVT